ncbi:unnamed protein product [Brachionus calyciflorus]|uniref:Uncharacterized protein n=1 Tax=Brachionus calyciflorus TaxID=104777 RepID=A0A814ELI2_9BILA|nr:unnamed protein product [Brachionus calyciflorus]
MTYKSFTNGTKHILDLIFCSTSLYSKFVNLNVIDNLLNSYHYPILIEYETSLNLNNDTIIEKKFDFRRPNWIEFSNELPTLIPEGIKENVSKINEFITTNLIKAAENTILKFNGKKRANILPKYVLDLIKYKNSIKIKSSMDKCLLNKIKKIIKEEIVALKSKSWENFY